MSTSGNRFQMELRRDVLRSLGYFREDSTLVIFLLILMGFSALLGLLQAWPLAVLVDSAVGTPADNNWMQRVFLMTFPNAPLAQIVALAVTALILRLLQEFVGTARRLVDLQVQYNGLMRARCDLYRKLQAMHIAYHRSQPLGDALFRLTTDTFGCHAVLSVMVNIAFAVVTLSVISALLMAKTVGLSLLALSVAPPLLWVNIKFGRRLKEKTIIAKESDSDFTTTVQRSMSAIVLTQAYGREDEEFKRFGATARKCVRHWFGIHRQELAYRLSVGAIFAVGGALLLTYGGILVHERRLSPGELMIFMTYLGMLYDPLCQITGAAMNLQNGLARARRVFEVLDRDVVVADHRKATSLPVQPRTWRVRMCLSKPCRKAIERNSSMPDRISLADNARGLLSPACSHRGSHSRPRRADQRAGLAPRASYSTELTLAQGKAHHRSG